MSRQIQIRRGTAAEHANFIGAAGELTFDGETLRVHDGATPGGITLARTDDLSTSSPIPDTADYVIETQLPTADNSYTWYRKYASGWIEQGGIWTGSITKNSGQEISFEITFPITMSSTNYNAFTSNSAKNYCMPGGIAKTCSGMLITFLPYEIQRTLTGADWFICGWYV